MGFDGPEADIVGIISAVTLEDREQTVVGGVEARTNAVVLDPPHGEREEQKPRDHESAT